MITKEDFSLISRTLRKAADVVDRQCELYDTQPKGALYILGGLLVVLHASCESSIHAIKYQVAGMKDDAVTRAAEERVRAMMAQDAPPDSVVN